MSIGKQCIRMAKPLAERFPRVMKTYRYMRDIRQLHEEPKNTPMGFRLIGNREMEDGSYEPEETEIARKVLEHVDIFINVGANIGYYCCLALNYGKYSVAFEPIQLNLQYLYKNIKANHGENKIEIFPIALSDKTGILNIYGGGHGASLVKRWEGTAEHNVTQVPISTMDNILAYRFQGKRCFIIIDIEGAERVMLGGAGSFLGRQPKPIWMVEITISEHQPKGVKVNPNLLSTFQLFWDSGYEAWTAGKDIRLVSTEEVETIARSGKDTLLIHNFLFVDKGIKEQILEA